MPFRFARSAMRRVRLGLMQILERVLGSEMIVKMSAEEAWKLRKDDPIAFFQLWEKYGLHVTPVHFYSPIPDTRKLPESIWTNESSLPGVDMNEDVQLDFLRTIFPAFRAEYESIPFKPTDIRHEYYLDNGAFSGTDAMVSYCMIRHHRPAHIIEVGSGFSSRLAAQAAIKMAPPNSAASSLIPTISSKLAFQAWPN
jgi:hypothetical protein